MCIFAILIPPLLVLALGDFLHTRVFYVIQFNYYVMEIELSHRLNDKFCVWI